MPERKTLLFRPSGVPVAQPAQTGAPGGAFGDFRGLAATGQALGNVAQAGFQFAQGQKNDTARLREEMDNRTMRDYQLKHQNALDLAVLGVRKEYEQKLNSGDFMDGGSFNWLETRLGEAKAQASESLAQYTQDPLYKKAVSHDLTEHLWLQRTDNLRWNAAGQEGVAKQQGRLDDLDTMVGASFAGVEPGQHAQVSAELAQKNDLIEAMPINRGAKNNLRRQLADRAFDTVMRGLDRGVRVPPEVVNNANFSPGQRRMIEALDSKVGKPKDMFAGTAEAQKVLQASLELKDLSADPVAYQTARYAADHLAEHAESPEAKRYAHAAIDLKLAEQAVTKNNFASVASLGGQKLYQRLSSLSTTLADEKQADAFYESFGIKGADPKDRSRFLAAIRAAADTKLDLINTGRANAVADQSDALSPIAAAAGAEFNSDGGITRETAQRYVRASAEEQTFMGVPEHLQVHVPAKVVDGLVDRIWNGDTTNGSKMITAVGSSFGSQALNSVATSFLMPSKSAKDKSTLDATQAKNRTYAALFKVAASDHSRVESGARDLELAPVLKQWMDDLGNYEKNSSTFPRHSALAAQKAFNLSSFKDPVSQKELLNLEQIGTITSKVQSLPGIAKGLYWHSGQNNDMSVGFQEMMTRIIQSQAYSAGTTAGEDKQNREFLAVDAVDRLNNFMARVFTVVPTGGMENKKQILDLIPTKLVSEDALSIPVQYGAANTADLGNQIADVLQYASYYEPRKFWDRGRLGNAGVVASNLARGLPVVGSLFSTGVERVAPLPPHLTVDWSKVSGITPDHLDTGGNNYLKELVVKADPSSKFTTNSIAFVQNGAWRYNWKTGNFEAMLFPGRSNSPASPSIAAPGPAQPLNYNLGSPERPLLRPVTLRGEEVRQFDYIYRKSRVSSSESSIEYIR